MKNNPSFTTQKAGHQALPSTTSQKQRGVQIAPRKAAKAGLNKNPQGKH